MTGPCESDAIQRGEPFEVRAQARRIDQMFAPLREDLRRLEAAVSRLEGPQIPRRPRLRLVTPEA